MRRAVILTIALCFAQAQAATRPATRPVTSPATRPASAPVFRNGLPTNEHYFPLAVWLQDPRNAVRYREIGINLYVGLWQGPTEEQLLALERAGMPAICFLNEYAQANLHRRIIVGWMHPDEPDNAKSPGPGQAYGPPVAPQKVVEAYRWMKKKDPTRPVFMNLGQGVAWDDWHGRGVRTNHPEDYPLYVRGADIVCFDIYPVTHDKPAVAGNLWYVGLGVQRLRAWCNNQKPVWACIETAHVDNPAVRPTPEQIRAEVWMALIHGARGLMYFPHEFKPQAREHALLCHEDARQAVALINRQIHALAPALNSPTLDIATVRSSNAQAPLALMVKRRGRTTYIFTVNLRNETTTGAFALSGFYGVHRITVLGEDRTINMRGGKWEDTFKGYDVHLYQVER